MHEMQRIWRALHSARHYTEGKQSDLPVAHRVQHTASRRCMTAVVHSSTEANTRDVHSPSCSSKLGERRLPIAGRTDLKRSARHPAHAPARPRQSQSRLLSSSSARRRSARRCKARAPARVSPWLSRPSGPNMKHSATECRVGTRSLRPLRKTALRRARSRAVKRLPSAAAAARRLGTAWRPCR